MPNDAQAGLTGGGPAQRAVSAALATAAIALPTLIAFNESPSTTFYNQAAALAGWGAWLLWLGADMPVAAARVGRGLGLLLAALGLITLANLISPLWTHLPSSLALGCAAHLLAAGLAAWVAASLARAGRAEHAFEAMAIGLVLAGLGGSAVGLAQVFVPDLSDGDWIAATSFVGRAVGNLRQPNHLSSLLLWSVVAAVWLGERRPPWAWPTPGAANAPRGNLGWRTSMLMMAALMVFVIVLTGSRTGAVGTLLLALWGMVDRQMTRTSRIALISAPLLYAVGWAGMDWWALHGQHNFGGANRFSLSGDPSSSRFGIWSNTWALIKANPWLGVGFGEFNLAWTLTPFPGRPVAFFDHTHNLLLQWAVELGLPLTALITLLMSAALWAAVQGARRAPQPAPQRAALVMLLMALIHSLLEYPLWYAYFLLPAAFAFGLGLGGPRTEHGEHRGPEDLFPSNQAPKTQGTAQTAATSEVPPAQGVPAMVWGGLLLALGALGSVADYHRITPIFSTAEDGAPLALRIQRGQGSVFFAYHADYAAATTPEHPSQAMPAFTRAPHYLLDTRLMIAWAKALHEVGDDQSASYIAQRLREFRNPDADEFFQPCKAAPAGATAAGSSPFQCVAPTRSFTYADFR
jgi:O-antigen ligase